MIAYSWKLKENAPCVNLPEIDLDFGSLPSGPKDLPFTRFTTQEAARQDTPENLQSHDVASAAHVSSASASAVLDGCEDGLGRVECVRLQDAVDTSLLSPAYSMAKVAQMDYDRLRLQNVRGFTDGGSSVAREIVEILGQSSKAGEHSGARMDGDARLTLSYLLVHVADTVLAHSIVNGNVPLTDALIARGVT